MNEEERRVPRYEQDPPYEERETTEEPGEEDDHGDKD